MTNAPWRPVGRSWLHVRIGASLCVSVMRQPAGRRVQSDRPLMSRLGPPHVDWRVANSGWEGSQHHPQLRWTTDNGRLLDRPISKATPTAISHGSAKNSMMSSSNRERRGRVDHCPGCGHCPARRARASLPITPDAVQGLNEAGWQCLSGHTGPGLPKLARPIETAFDDRPPELEDLS